MSGKRQSVRASIRFSVEPCHGEHVGDRLGAALGGLITTES